MKVKRKVGDDAVTASMIENQKNGLAEAVSNIRKSVNEELEELRRSRAAYTNNRFLNFDNSEAKKSLPEKVLVDGEYDYVKREAYKAKLKQLGGKSPIANAGNQVVFNINDFYKEQRKKTKVDRKKKHEAFKDMNTYKQSFFDHSIVSARLSNAKKYEEEVVQKAEYAKLEKLKSMTNFFVNSSYKAFVFATHPKHGMLLLFCTKKKIKGDHFQLPGGGINESEFQHASKRSGGDPRRQLILASKHAVIRKLREDTGIDIRENIKRLKPAHLRFDSECYNQLSCEHRKRLFFTLEVMDNDFFALADVEYNENLESPIDGEGIPLMLKLSKEHSGFKFQKDLNESIQEIKKHSGKACSEALQLKAKKNAAEAPSKKKINRIIAHIEDDIKSISSSTGHPRKSKRKVPKKKIGKISSMIKSIEERSTNGSAAEYDDMSDMNSSYTSGSISGTSWDSNSSEGSDTRQNLIGLTFPLNILPQEEDLDDELDDDFAFDSTQEISTNEKAEVNQSHDDIQNLLQSTPQLNETYHSITPKTYDTNIKTEGINIVTPRSPEIVKTPTMSNSISAHPIRNFPNDEHVTEILFPNDLNSRTSLDSFGRSTTSSQKRVIFPHLYKNKANSDVENKIGLEVMFEVAAKIENGTETNSEGPNTVTSEKIDRNINMKQAHIQTNSKREELGTMLHTVINRVVETSPNDVYIPILETKPAEMKGMPSPMNRNEDDSIGSYKDFYSDDEEHSTPTQQTNPFNDLACIFCFQFPGKEEKKKRRV